MKEDDSTYENLEDVVKRCALDEKMTIRDKRKLIAKAVADNVIFKNLARNTEDLRKIFLMILELEDWAWHYSTMLNSLQKRLEEHARPVMVPQELYRDISERIISTYESAESLANILIEYYEKTTLSFQENWNIQNLEIFVEKVAEARSNIKNPKIANSISLGHIDNLKVIKEFARWAWIAFLGNDRCAKFMKEWKINLGIAISGNDHTLPS